MRFDGVDTSLNTATGVINRNEWNHIGLVLENNSQKIYINGVANSFTTAGIPDSGVVATIIGRSQTNTFVFNGSMDEFRQWKGVALSENEMIAESNSHYPVVTDGLVTSYSFESYNATHVSDTNWNVLHNNTIDNSLEGAISFNGSQYNDISSIDESSIRTFSFDFYTNSFSNYDRPFSLYGSASNRFYCDLRTGSPVRLQCYNDILNVNEALSYSPSFNLNEWNTLTIVDNGTNFIHYFNGVEYQSFVYSKGFSDITGMNFYLGDYDATLTESYKGFLIMLKSLIGLYLLKKSVRFTILVYCHTALLTAL